MFYEETINSSNNANAYYFSMCSNNFKSRYTGKDKIENVKEDTLDSDLTVIVKSGGKYYEVYMSQGYQEYSGYRRGKTLSVWGTVRRTAYYVVKRNGKKNKKMTIPSIKSRYDKLS